MNDARFVRTIANPQAMKAYEFLVAYLRGSLKCSTEESAHILEAMYFGMLSLCRSSGLVRFPNGLTLIDGSRVSDELLETYRCKILSTLKRASAPAIYTAASNVAVLQTLALMNLEQLEQKGITLEVMSAWIAKVDRF